MKNAILIYRILVFTTCFLVVCCSSEADKDSIVDNKEIDPCVHFDDEIYGRWVVMPEETVNYRKGLFPKAEANWNAFQKSISDWIFVLDKGIYKIIVNGKQGKKLTSYIVYSNVGLTVISTRELGIPKYIKKINKNKIRIEMGRNQVYICKRYQPKSNK